MVPTVLPEVHLRCLNSDCFSKLLASFHHYFTMTFHHLNKAEFFKYRYEKNSETLEGNVLLILDWLCKRM